MFKTIALIGLAAALAVLPAAAPAQQGTTESYGSIGRGPHIPTQSLTPFDRAWNHNNQSEYDADCNSAWNKDPVFGVIGIQSGPRG